MTTSITPLGGDYSTNAYFLVEIQGVELGVFRELSGLQVTVETVPIPEGGQNGYVRKVPGRMDWPNLVLKRGLTDSDVMLDWLNKSSGQGFAAQNNKLARTTVSITAMDSSGNRLRAWNVVDAFPVRWKGPDFSVDGRDTLQEELEITHNGFTAETDPQ